MNGPEACGPEELFSGFPGARAIVHSTANVSYASSPPSFDRLQRATSAGEQAHI